MADRLTQLQDAVNMQAENLCNSIGILQQFAPPSYFPEFEKSKQSHPNQNQEDYAQLFASLIARTAKDIDILIESLPNEDSTADFQAQAIKSLEMKNQDAADKLEETVKRGEKLLEEIQKALHDIGEAQLKMRCLHNEAMNMCTSDSAPSSSSAGSTSAAASSQSHGPS